jgi:transposase
MGRSRGGLTTKVHALVDANGLPLELVLTPGQAGDCPVAARLLGHLRENTIVLADKAYDADWLRRQIEAAGAAPNIPPMIHRRWKPCFSPVLYRARNRIERFFNRIKHFRRSPRDTKNTPPTSSPCSNSLPPNSGCAIMSL